MKISTAIDYAASPAEVYEMLTDPAFQELKCDKMGSTSREVSVTPNGDGDVVVASRTAPTDDFPDFAKSMIGSSITIVETFTWGPPAADDAREGTLTVAVGDAPLGMSATVSIAPGGPGTVMTIDGDLKARIPIIGGKIEKAAAPAIQRAIRIEHRTGQGWLAS